MTRCWRLNGFQLAIASSVLVGGAIASVGDCVIAQITPDGTLPNNSIVTSQGNTSVIEGGTKAGSNLFHSFEQFSVPTGGAAHFNNALDVQNIFSRVTGKFISNIDGLIRANGTANLFLLNPNGIIFGPNATLNIVGSFLASTASSLIFEDVTEFSATAPQTTELLTISVPTGLQFGETAGSIRVDGLGLSNSLNSLTRSLQVQSGKTLALVGGDVNLDGRSLKAPGGRVELGGLAGSGTVGLRVDSNNIGLSFPVGVRRADVYLTNAFVDVTAGNGGNIAINARNLDILNESGLAAGIGEGLGTVGSQAGDIMINATGALNIARSSIFNEVWFRSVGKGGNIDITADSVTVTNDAVLTTGAYGQGDAGSVNINAHDQISFSDGKIQTGVTGILPGGESVGNGGTINITAGSLSVTDGFILYTSVSGQAKGNAGSVNINARGTVSFDGANVYFDEFELLTNEEVITPSGISSGVGPRTAVGNGGDINITAESVAVTNGALLSSGTGGQGNAGNVNIHARSTVSFDGETRFSSGFPVSSRVSSSVGSGGVGNGGDINITAESVTVTNGATLNSSSQGQGNAGNVTITARDAVSFDGVDSHGLSSRAFSSVDFGGVGNGGNINITTGQLVVRDGAEVNVSSTGSGDAGNLEVAARSIHLDNQGNLSAESALGNSGNIRLQAEDLLLMRRSSNISTFLESGTRNNGNIDIDTNLLVAIASENSDIAANDFLGQGGNVKVTAQGIFGIKLREQLTPESDIVGSGTVELVAPDVDPAQGLATLPAELVEVSGLIASSCAAVGENKFTITGRGGLPPSPSEVLSSDAVWVDWVTRNPKVENSSSPTVSTNPTATEPAPIVEARGWVINEKGEVVLTVNAPTATPYIPWLTQASCHTSETSS